MLIAEKHARKRFESVGFDTRQTEPRRSRLRYRRGLIVPGKAAIGPARAKKTLSSGSLPLLLSVRRDGDAPGSSSQIWIEAVVVTEGAVPDVLVGALAVDP